MPIYIFKYLSSNMKHGKPKYPVPCDIHCRFFHDELWQPCVPQLDRRVTIATSQLQRTATSELHARNRLRATCGDVISSCGWPRCPYKEDRESVIRAMAGDLDTSDHPWSAYIVSKSDSDSSIYSGFCYTLEEAEEVIREFSYASHSTYVLKKTTGDLRNGKSFFF